MSAPRLTLNAGLALLAAFCVPPSTAARPVAPPAPPVQPAPQQQSPTAWLDSRLSPDARADRLVSALTQDEKLTIVSGYFGIQKDWNHYRFPEARPQSAGLVRGVPRVGFPPQWQSDAGSGVATMRAN